MMGLTNLHLDILQFGALSGTGARVAYESGRPNGPAAGTGEMTGPPAGTVRAAHRYTDRGDTRPPVKKFTVSI
jgi:hypothetical protein